ncbi:MAG: hypothetical protein IPL26_13370 [Leptospiraceae bacterium]|nr:hypothetical protein [Leptospiraceae bacterium]
MSRNKFDIRTYKKENEICKIVEELGSHILTETSHTFKTFGSITILEAKKSALKYSNKAKEKPAIVLIDIVLAANRNYNKVVEPNIRKIEENYPELKSIKDLENLLKRKTKKEFFLFWGHKDEKKYKTLTLLLERIQKLKKVYKEVNSDYKIINKWAQNANILEVKKDIIGSIPNISIATVQHLRMNFGIDTVKPDQRVKEVLETEFDIEKINDLKGILAVEQIASITKYKVIEIDQIFVKFGSGYYNKNAKLNIKVIAKNLKDLNVPTDIISKATLLTERQIIQL